MYEEDCWTLCCGRHNVQNCSNGAEWVVVAGAVFTDLLAGSFAYAGGVADALVEGCADSNEERSRDFLSSVESVQWT